MARTVFCEKLKKEAPGMQFKPWQTELGQRIYDHVSAEAWKMWTEHFKMIMNEYRLAGGSADANKTLFDQAEKFFFGGDQQTPAAPPDFKAPPAH